MTTGGRYKIVIIEPSPVIRQGLKMLLDASPDFEVTCHFPDYESFEERHMDASFHVILINPAIINFHRHFAVKSLFREYPRAVIAAILYNYVDSETINSFDGVLDIYDEGPRLIKKLKKIIETAHPAENRYNTENTDLSEREKEILISVAVGLANKEIAEKHCISIHTVISHRKNISRKVGIKTVSGLTIYAIFNNLISEEDL